ncbi:hypothetical protein RclHR1_33040001, partial [Rhizophagus clarus]
TQYKIDTYGNYIKLAIMCPDSRFRLHLYWPHYSYINLEKYRNHQNKTRLIRQKITDNHTLPTVTDLITESVYSERKIIDKSFTTTLPSFIRTAGDSFWRKKEYQLNTIVQNFGLLQIFYTMNYGQNNCPFHTYHYYTNKLQSLHHYLWNNPTLSNLEITYFDNETSRFIYCRTKPEDQWVISYHAPTLLLWEAHHNFQYVTDKHFAKYICKYVTKPEPSELFDIQETDAYRRHIHARRLGTMELMLLLMSKKVSRCTIAVDFLPTSPPEF